MPKIYVSHQDRGREFLVAKITENLEEVFGKANVISSKSILARPNQASVRHKEIKSSDIFIAIIDDHTKFSILKKFFRSQLFDSRNRLRTDTLIALRSDNQCKVIPVILENTPGLSHSNLPEELSQLLDIGYIVIKSNNFEYDIDRLIIEINSIHKQNFANPALNKPSPILKWHGHLSSKVKRIKNIAELIEMFVIFLFGLIFVVGFSFTILGVPQSTPSFHTNESILTETLSLTDIFNSNISTEVSTNSQIILSPFTSTFTPTLLPIPSITPTNIPTPTYLPVPTLIQVHIPSATFTSSYIPTSTMTPTLTPTHISKTSVIVLPVTQPDFNMLPSSDESSAFTYTDLITFGLYADCVLAEIRGCNSPERNLEDARLNGDPVETVSWSSAQAYCEFIEARLPDKIELEIIYQLTDVNMVKSEWVSDEERMLRNSSQIPISSSTDLYVIIGVDQQYLPNISFRCVREY